MPAFPLRFKTSLFTLLDLGSSRGLGHQAAAPPAAPFFQLHPPTMPIEGVDEGKQVMYAAGWRPEPYEPRQEVWAKMMKGDHCKISDYHVCRNDKEATSWNVQLCVSGADYKALWRADDPKTVVATLEDGCIIFRKKGEDGEVEPAGAYIKLPKSCDPNSELVVNTPVKGGFFVTVNKLGFKGTPTPLHPIILGDEPPFRDMKFDPEIQPGYVKPTGDSK